MAPSIPASRRQVRAARAWLGIGRPALSLSAGLAEATLFAVETGPDTGPAPELATMVALTRALEALGVRFIFDSVGGNGFTVDPAAKLRERPELQHSGPGRPRRSVPAADSGAWDVA